MTLEWSESPAGKVSVGAFNLEYACYGPPPTKAPTLVLLHEGLGCCALWRDFPERLSHITGLGVFVYSRAGYGQSDPVALPRPLDYMTREAEDVLGPVLDQAGVQSAILLGHSDGASIATIYAGSTSDQRVRGLILVAPHFFTEPAGLAAIAEAGQAFESGNLRERMAKYHRNPDVAFKGWHDAWTDPGFVSWNIADAIDHLRIPVLAIQGRDDAYGTLAQIEELESRIYSPLETLTLDDCGHAPHLEQQALTLSAIEEFCARLVRLERERVALG